MEITNYTQELIFAIIFLASICTGLTIYAFVQYYKNKQLKNSFLELKVDYKYFKQDIYAFKEKTKQIEQELSLKMDRHYQEILAKFDKMFQEIKTVGERFDTKVDEKDDTIIEFSSRIGKLEGKIS